MAYNERKYLRFYGESGAQYRISIKELDYAGASSLVTAESVPALLKLAGDGSEDFEPINNSTLKLNLVAESASELDFLRSAADKTIRVDVTKDAVADGSFWLLADQNDREYTSPPFGMSFECTDGLVFLEELEYNSSGRASELSIIAEILQSTGLELPIHVTDGVFASNMNSANTDSGLAQTYIEKSVFRNSDGDPFTMLETLSEILRDKGLQIRQSAGHWSIFRPAERAVVHRVIVYDFEGTYVSNALFSNTIAIDGSAAYFIGRSQNESNLTPLSEKGIDFEFGTIGNLIPDGDFESNRFSGTDLINFTKAGSLTYSKKVTAINGSNHGLEIDGKQTTATFDSGAYLEYDPNPTLNNIAGSALKIYFDADLAFTTNTRSYSNRDLTVRLRVKVGSYYLVGSPGSLTWTPSLGYLDVSYMLFVGTGFNLITPPLTADGDLEVRLYPLIDDSSSANDLTGVIIDNLRIDVFLDEEYPDYKSSFLGTIANSSTKKGEILEVILGDAPSTLHDTGFQISGGNITSTWDRRGQTDGLRRLEITILDYLKMYSSAFKIYDGALRVPGFNFDTVFTLDSADYLVRGGVYNYRDEILEATIRELPSSDPTITYSEIISEAPSESTGSTSSGSSSPSGETSSADWDSIVDKPASNSEWSSELGLDLNLWDLSAAELVQMDLEIDSLFRNKVDKGRTIQLLGGNGIALDDEAAKTLAEDLSFSIAVDYNTTNLKMSSGKLNTIQDIDTSAAVTFATVDTGQGANELYPMDQAVLEASNVTFADIVANGTLYVYGDIIQSGASYETHAEEVYTTNDLIITRDGAVSGLGVGEISGFKVLKADGTNSLIFGSDSDAVGRIGWEGGTMQAIATREDTPTDTGLAFWDDAATQFATSTDLTFDGTNLSLGNQASAAGHALRADRSITIGNDADSVLTWSTNTQDLTADRTFTPTLSDHGDGQRGVLNIGSQSIYGAKTFENNTFFKGSIGTDIFASQTTGWKGTYAGDFDVRSLYADEIRAKAFTAEVSQAFRGRRHLAKSFGELAADFTIPALSSTADLIVSDVDGFAGYNVFEEDDFVEILIIDRSSGLFVGFAWGTVAAPAGGTDNGDGSQTWEFTTVDVGNLGSSSYVARKGTEAVSYGSAATPVGFIEDTVLDTLGAPYSQVVTWTTNPYTPGNKTVETRLGVLDGLTFNGESLTGAGAYFKDNLFIELGGGLAYFGKGVNATNDDDGFFLNANNYWLTAGGFKVQIDGADLETSIIDLKKDLIEIYLQGDNAYSGVQFLSEQIILKVDSNGKLATIRLDGSGADSVISIAADQINIDGTTTFSSGYDPSTKETPAGAQSKANAAAAGIVASYSLEDLNSLAYLAAVETAQLGTTVISGGYLVTSLIDVASLYAQSATITSTLTLGTGGSFVSDVVNFSKTAFELSVAGLEISSASKSFRLKNGTDIVVNINDSAYTTEEYSSTYGTEFVTLYDDGLPTSSSGTPIVLTWSNGSLATSEINYNQYFTLTKMNLALADSSQACDLVATVQGLDASSNWVDIVSVLAFDGKSISTSFAEYSFDNEINFFVDPIYSDFRISLFLTPAVAQTWAFVDMKGKEIKPETELNRTNLDVTRLRARESIELVDPFNTDSKVQIRFRKKEKTTSGGSQKYEVDLVTYVDGDYSTTTNLQSITL